MARTCRTFCKRFRSCSFRRRSICLRRDFPSATSELNSKNAAGETPRQSARATMRSKEGFFSPRSMRPRCFTSTSTFSATCHNFKLLDLRVERRRLPNLDAGVMDARNKTLAKRRGQQNAPTEHYYVDKEACRRYLSVERQLFHGSHDFGRVAIDGFAHFIDRFEFCANETTLD
jgi:hypothetical protein